MVLRVEEVELSRVVVLRDSRQRREANPANLLESIKARGVLNPIILAEDFTLIAGERRLEACKALGLPTIPVRFLSDLSPIEAQIVELEENLKRSDLCWQDQARAIANLHALYQSENPEWTQEETAKALDLSGAWISTTLRVVRDMHQEKVPNAVSLNSAYNMLSRVDDRKIGDALSDLLEAGQAAFSGKSAPSSANEPELASGTSSPVPSRAPLVSPSSIVQPAKEPSESESILQEDFVKWADNYIGPTFNILHCDFPYGIEFNKGSKSGKNSWEMYDDSADTYWTLVRALCRNLDKIMAHSGHMVFWFSMGMYHKTLEAFRERAPSLEFFPMPLIWHKTDNVGILPDPRHGPRQVYETAFLASRDSRQIVKAVSNCYGAPTSKDHHPSTKPEPVLRHYLSMIADEHSSLLDPTCGSGSSLRAAESLGVKRVLGLEFNPEYCANARSALRHSRVLRKVSK